MELDAPNTSELLLSVRLPETVRDNGCAPGAVLACLPCSEGTIPGARCDGILPQYCAGVHQCWDAHCGQIPQRNALPP